MEMGRRLAIFGDDKLKSYSPKVNYSRLGMCLNAIQPDVVYITLMPGITLSTIKVLNSLLIPYVLVFPDTRWGTFFTKSERALIKKAERKAYSIVYLNKSGNVSLGKEVMYLHAADYLDSTCNLRMSLVSGAGRGKGTYMEDLIPKLNSNKNKYHLIIEYNMRLTE